MTRRSVQRRKKTEESSNRIPPESQWFSAKFLFGSRVDDGTGRRALCETQIVLFRAINEDEARKAAYAYARSEEISYLNMDQQSVKWFLVSLENLEAIEESPEHGGWEVASWFSYRSAKALEKKSRT